VYPLTLPQAGFCILTEAGGVAFGGKTSSLSGDIDAGLMGQSNMRWGVHQEHRIPLQVKS
jgi:hypothetical protein